MNNKQLIKERILNWLSEPRQLGMKQIGQLAMHFDCEDPLAVFSSLPLEQEMEPFELEQFLSSLFTPDLNARIQCQPYLSDDGLTTSERQDLIEQIYAQHPSCPIVGVDEGNALTIPEIIIERFVRLLRLDQTAQSAAQLRRLTNDNTETCNHALALSRDKAWSSPTSATLLESWLHQLSSSNQTKRFSVDKFAFLTEFVSTNRPGNIIQLKEMIRHYHEACKTETHVYHDEAHECSDVRAKHLTEEHKAFRLTISGEIVQDLLACG
ncbi:MAG: hypothetical protein HQL54_11940 [Magnetococcales bacterium]|nr:hypothetical protein [Magnetococcales bacterium]